ncbi:sex determination protein fruitless-like isoform X2 [Neocloeon triangulifer]|uniref:sex determination protein fruitless-like isoform X2 n=1 Tax=Neocloeon triangulifer TaxID=2078957 RepID=UPI00286F9D5D|nr:sex determination protein fruitless-like isoform X2 [Neocloeon triangulifer]
MKINECWNDQETAIRLCGEEGGGGEMGSASQQYCLRWNNHRTNLLTVFDQLLQSEAFTDCTLACEGATIKCHKMVLAACSTYFQMLFLEVACSHPVVVLKDIRYTDMKAILEYMYRGEVNVAQDQLASLLKVAEALKVKGLVEDNSQNLASNGEPAAPSSPPTISTSANISSLPPNLSPPHSAGLLNPFSKNYMYSKSILGGAAAAAAAERARLGSLPMWAMPGLPPGMPPLASHSLSSSYDSPLKRKKLQSLLNNRDTPILRTVLGQSLQQPATGSSASASPPGSSQSPAADSSQQPVSLVCHPERAQSNGSAHSRSYKGEPSMDDDQHSYSDINVDEEMNESVGKMMLPGSTHPTYSGDMKGGIAPYVPAQKPEWKRYKQYTRNDIMSAIDAVRNGMSALQAARKFGVPSRTLYDKVKKLGITTSRPFKRGSFQFGGGLSASQENLNHSGGNFCSQSDAEEQVSSDNIMGKSDDGRDEATAASVLIRASPCRSPSPPGLQGHFMSGASGHFRASSSPSPTASSGHSHDEVEDLSVSGGRKSSPLPPAVTQVAVPITPLHPHIVSLKESTIDDSSAVRTTTVGGGGDAEHD